MARAVALGVVSSAPAPTQIDWHEFARHHSAAVRGFQVVPTDGRLIAIATDDAGALATWVWDGSGWRAHGSDPALAGLAHPALAWDAQLRRVVLSGVRDDGRAAVKTWVWTGRNWHRRHAAEAVAAATVVDLGGGCRGGPRLRAFATAVGVQLELEGLPASGITQILVDDGAAAAGDGRQRDLGRLGMTGCVGAVEPLRSFAAIGVGGRAEIVVPWQPDGPATLRLQALALDPHTNPAGMTASNAVAIRLGD